MISTLLALVAFAPQTSFAQEVELLMRSRTEANVRRIFKDRSQAQPLFDFLIHNREPASWAMIPSPPGFHGDSQVIFSRFQNIQSESDVQFEVRDGKISAFIPEQNTFNYRIQKAAIVAKLLPAEHKISVDATLSLSQDAPAQSMVARLNSPYIVDKAWVDGKEAPVVTVEKAPEVAPKEGDVLRVGSLVVVWTSKPISKLRLTYTGVVNQPREDKITPNAAYVTAWWVPSIGRMPHVTDVSVLAPSAWQFRSEGKPVDVGSTEPAPEGMTWKRWQCDVPISFPKIIGGSYTLAYELKDGGKTYRSWQFEPISTKRGKTDCERMQQSMTFLEGKLPPYPWDSYECYDADTYYGIESYSHTLLQAKNTTRFVTHELTHTWFGGMAPNTYGKDTWNEGVTQYVDSILFGGDEDRTLGAGYRPNPQDTTPLSEMNIAHANGSIAYYRGAYVMNMLAEEIGMNAMWAGLRRLATDFRGQELTWLKLQAVFEAVSGKKLDWFWDQWVTNGVFPTIDEASDFSATGNGPVTVALVQSGTPKPFNLLFDIHSVNNKGKSVHVTRVRMVEPRHVFTVPDPGPGGYIVIGPLPASLAYIGSTHGLPYPPYQKGGGVSPAGE